MNFSHFPLLQNHCMPSYQIYHKCSSRGPEEVLYFFEVIRNPRWQPCPLIWAIHFQLLHQNYCIVSHKQWSSRSVFAIQSDLISNMVAPVCDWPRHFFTFFQHYMGVGHQLVWNVLLDVLEEVFILFGAIWNPRW